tara:strand:- start:876 stop:1007 length:132 start_codon:yes stop_codon:yes gene_type:complete
MTSTEKIENAKKRINELEELIQYWNQSENAENINLTKETELKI